MRACLPLVLSSFSATAPLLILDVEFSHPGLTAVQLAVTISDSGAPFSVVFQASSLQRGIDYVNSFIDMGYIVFTKGSGMDHLLY